MSEELIQVPPFQPPQATLQSLVTEFFDEQRQLFMESWGDKLWESFICSRVDVVSFQMSREFLEGVIRLAYDNISMDESEIPELNNLRHFFENKERRQGYFWKLSTRSPKDYQSAYSFIAKPLPVRSYDEFIDSLTRSLRVVSDIERFYHAGELPFIHITPYVTLDPLQEYRCFVVNGKFVAMSQYYHMLGTTGRFRKRDYVNAVRELIDYIKPEIPETVVVDVLIMDTKQGVHAKLLELNPLELSDPCLFTHAEILELSLQDTKVVAFRHSFAHPITYRL